ncbi:hypothetical protein Tcan_17007 [Toxocara canis]|uniref:G-protein coupled receptors family 1 profile domain-containing protein n=1 Tax=Toxocara canis TaxID=6265 RepID=A0A0B2UVB4_TOXCA|nr:hypothetical protein Tcan_17007 [Toxocara canis]
MILGLCAAYTVVGLIVFTLNTLFFISIIRTAHLRSKYIVISTQIANDALSGLGLLLAGSGRAIIWLTDPNSLKSRRYCMLMPWNIIFIWIEPMTGVSMLMVSLDRLLAILFPLKYFTRSTCIQYLEVAIPSAILALLTFESWYSTFPDIAETVSSACWSKDSWQSFHDELAFTLRLASAFGGMILYAAAFALSRRYQQRVSHTRYGDSMIAFQKRQSQLTVTLCISCIFTLVFYILPTVIEFIILTILGKEMNDVLTIYTGISSNISSLSNLVVLYVRQHDLAEAVNVYLPAAIRQRKNKAMVNATIPRAPFVTCPSGTKPTPS